MNESSSAEGDRLYAIEKTEEIVALFRRIIDRRCLFTVHIDAAETIMLTSVLAIVEGNRTLIIDTSPDETVNRRARQGRTLLFQTQLDQVDVRFRTAPLRPTLHFGMPAFAIDLPTNIYYLQQREHFRLQIPLSQAVTCAIIISSDDPAQPAALVQTSARDISVGGIGLALTLAQADMLESGQTYPECRISLPDHAPLSPRMRLCHMRRIKDTRGLVRIHAGFQLLDPHPSVQAAIQRYIMRVERLRIARDRGLA